MMSGGFPCICNFKKNKQTRRGDVGGKRRERAGAQKSRKSAGEEELTCGADGSGTCLPGRAAAGLGGSRERAQLPVPVLPQSLSVAASARFTRLSLHLPAPAGSRPAGRAGTLLP